MQTDFLSQGLALCSRGEGMVALQRDRARIPVPVAVGTGFTYFSGAPVLYVAHGAVSPHHPIADL